MNALLADVVAAASEQRGQITGDPRALTKTSWSEIHCSARRIAGGLRERGVRHGDAVGILAGNPADIAPVLQGIWLAGASATMLHQPLPRTDLNVWLADTLRATRVIGARIAVVGEPFGAVADALAAARVAAVPVAALAVGVPADPVPTVDDDVAFLQFTSGSTGRPKAVAITFRNVRANVRALESVTEFRPQRDVMINWLPLFHDMGMMGFLVGPMYAGGDVVNVTPLDFLDDPLSWARLVTAYRGTMSAAPNFAYALLAKRLERAPDGGFDLSSLRFVLSGAEPIDVEVVERFVRAGERFGLTADAVCPAYGLAEATLAVTVVRPDEHYSIDEVDGAALHASNRAVAPRQGQGRRYVRLGKPLPGFDLRVVTGDGTVAAARAVGEIQLRGDSVSPGTVTEEGFVPTTDGDGWLATGDLGYLDEDGQLVVCGRCKDVIIVSGRNVYPADVERAAAQVRGVRPGNAAAVRLEDGPGSEGFAMLIESTAVGDDGECARIAREVADRVQAELGVTPRRVRVVAVGTIPKTPSGKLRRLQARELLVPAGDLAS